MTAIDNIHPKPPRSRPTSPRLLVSKSPPFFVRGHEKQTKRDEYMGSTHDFGLPMNGTHVSVPILGSLKNEILH
jgi:hypothetical protein